MPGISCRALLPALAAALLAAFPAAAQAVRASVTDAVTGAPVPEALVRVEAEDGSVVGATFTRGDGTAVVRLREGGSYRVTAHSGGYDPVAQPLAMGPGGTVEVRCGWRSAPLPWTRWR